MIGVLVVDDHPVVLTGLKALIDSDAQLSVVGTARSAGSARELPNEPTPDGGGPGPAATRWRRDLTGRRAQDSRWPDLRVLILTMNADEATVIRSLASGLNGYLLKDADPEDVLAAVHSAAGGALVIGSSVSAVVTAAAASAPRSDALAALDARDLEILELMVQGLPTSQVAARLYLAPKTIRNRISEMLGKLGVSSREEAVALGRAGGLGH